MEIGVGGLESVVEPAAEVVFASAGVWEAKEGGDLGVDVGVAEEEAGRVLEGGERGRDGGEDGGE